MHFAVDYGDSQPDHGQDYEKNTMGRDIGTDPGGPEKDRDHKRYCKNNNIGKQRDYPEFISFHNLTVGP